jgi:trimeric autotransporter adhesin
MSDARIAGSDKPPANTEASQNLSAAASDAGRGTTPADMKSATDVQVKAGTLPALTISGVEKAPTGGAKIDEKGAAAEAKKEWAQTAAAGAKPLTPGEAAAAGAAKAAAGVAEAGKAGAKAGATKEEVAEANKAGAKIDPTAAGAEAGKAAAELAKQGTAGAEASKYGAKAETAGEAAAAGAKPGASNDSHWYSGTLAVAEDLGKGALNEVTQHPLRVVEDVAAGAAIGAVVALTAPEVGIGILAAGAVVAGYEAIKNGPTEVHNIEAVADPKGHTTAELAQAHAGVQQLGGDAVEVAAGVAGAGLGGSQASAFINQFANIY